MMTWARVLKWMIRIVLWSCLFEWIMFWMTTEEALHDDIFEKISVGRRGLSLFLLFIAFLMIQFIYGWDGHELVTQLT